MKNFRLILTLILTSFLSLSSIAQDVEIPFSWVGPGFTNTSTTGIFQCGSMNITLNTGGSPHLLEGSSASIPDDFGMTTVPITLTFSKPVCNLSVLIRDLDESTGGPSESILFTGAHLPVSVSPSAGGLPFILSGTTADPDGQNNTEAWVNWVEPLTTVTFQYNRANVHQFGLLLDSLKFDCDCSTPENLDCCYGNGVQTLSWGEVPGAVGYELEFGFNDNTSSCCYSATGFPFGLMESVTENYFVVPDSFTDCFWWRVRTEFADGSFSDWSEKLCDCDEEETPPCKAPNNLDCDLNSIGAKTLTWDPVAGALGYELSITYNDPACCPAGSGTVSTVTINTTDPFYTETDGSVCFSWKVRTECTNEPTYSEWSETKCSSECIYPTARPKRAEIYDGNDKSSSKLNASIVPNPASEFITITVEDNDEITEFENTRVLLTSTTGMLVFEEDIDVKRSKKIDLKSIAPGAYICTITSGDETLYSSRLIIQ